jgi:hypothetical protein
MKVVTLKNINKFIVPIKSHSIMALSRVVILIFFQLAHLSLGIKRSIRITNIISGIWILLLTMGSQIIF